MFGINRKNGRLGIAILAGLGLAGVASQARATAIPYSTGFGTADGFTTSQSWPTGTPTTLNGWTNSYSPNSNTSSTASIVSTPGGLVEPGAGYGGPTPSGSNPTFNPAFSNNQVLQFSIGPSTTFLGVSPTFSGQTNVVSPATTTITTEGYLSYNTPTYTTGTPDAGPYFGINLYGNTGGVNIGGLVVDASNNEIYLSNGSTLTGLYFDGSAATLDPAEWDQLKLVAAFTGNGVDATSISLSAYVDGVLLSLDAGGDITSEQSANDGGVASFDYAYLSGGTLGNPNASDLAANDVADFGNYSISASQVPEPMGASVIGVCGLLLAGRRTRRKATVS